MLSIPCATGCGQLYKLDRCNIYVYNFLTFTIRNIAASKTVNQRMRIQTDYVLYNCFIDRSYLCDYIIVMYSVRLTCNSYD